MCYPLGKVRSESMRRARVAKLANVADSKSAGRKALWVRLPPRAPISNFPIFARRVWLCFARLNRSGLRLARLVEATAKRAEVASATQAGKNRKCKILAK